MLIEEWHRRWIGVLTLSGYQKNQAEAAFESAFKDVVPDLTIDPANNALTYLLVQPASNPASPT